MSEATYVAFVPRRQRSELLKILTSEDTGPLSWRERRTFGGSELYLSGPPALARKAHTYIVDWLMARAAY